LQKLAQRMDDRRAGAASAEESKDKAAH
jgi:hypothetical protein